MEKISTIIDLEAALRTLHQARVVAAGYKSEIRKGRQSWDAEHKGLLDGDATAKEVLATSDAYARELAVAAFKATGDKHPAPGADVKDKTTVKILDAAGALAWAVKHELALKLDLEAFEDIVKLQKGGIPGVAEVVMEPQATIATDLSKFVEG